jgi:IstB-like ATP binding protein
VSAVEERHEEGCSCAICMGFAAGTSAARHRREELEAQPVEAAVDDRSFQAALAEARKLRGLEVDAGTRPIARCECGVEVPSRGDICATCSDRFAAQLRRDSLRRAWATLPNWRHAELGPDLPVHPRIREAALAWTRRSGSMLLCSNGTGVGKTTAAVAIARSIIARASRQQLAPESMRFAAGVRMVSARDLASAGRHSKLGEMPRLERTARNASLLILDEAGFEMRMGDDLTAICDVLDARYCPKDGGEPRLTITTAGLSLEDLTRRYGASMVRRMGSDRGVVVEVLG